MVFFPVLLIKGLGQNKSSRLAGLFNHLLRHEKSFIALLCASFRSSNMTENPAQYGTIYSCRGPNKRIVIILPHAAFKGTLRNEDFRSKSKHAKNFTAGI
jgi:hypothetical protein